MKDDIRWMGLRPKVKRPPLFVLREIADMFGMKETVLRSMMQVASRHGQWLPPIHLQAGHGGRPTISPKRNYYRKADFVKFLKQEKENETTNPT